VVDPRFGRRPSGADPVDDPEFRARLQKALGENYAIEKLIGEGGFGRVYSGRDIRLDRSVAIKVIKPDLAGARAFSDRFRKEAMALAKFRHPGIVPIFDIQESEGLIYFIMPLIAGDTLRARLQKYRVVAPQETRKLLVELCECLAATHRAGIVHRDIKPDNVILEKDAIARALLMDFGIAKSVADFDGTISGMMIGTPTYMSPEQANGDGTIDHRSDIYSVGVLGYHMLTGRPPFVGATMQEVTMGHMVKTPEPIRKLNPSVPKGLADAIHRCLEKAPADRFQSAVDLSVELQRVVFSEYGPVVEPEGNYAMALLFALALAFLIAGLLGPERLILFARSSWMWTAGAFAFMAVVCSPVVRASTDPWSRKWSGWIKRRLKRV
jgi:serine/threonine protein kinase